MRKLDQWQVMKQSSEGATEPAARPKSADSAELQRYRQRDIENAVKARQALLLTREASTNRNMHLRKVSTGIAATIHDKIKRDPERVWKSTAASESNKLSDETIDILSHKRGNNAAHSSFIPLTAYDSKLQGRAPSIWLPRGIL